MTDTKRNEPEKLLTVKAVADLLGVHPQTVYDLARSGELKARKVLSEWRSDGKRYSPCVQRRSLSGRRSQRPTVGDGSLVARRRASSTARPRGRSSLDRMIDYARRLIRKAA